MMLTKSGWDVSEGGEVFSYNVDVHLHKKQFSFFHHMQSFLALFWASISLPYPESSFVVNLLFYNEDSGSR